VKDGIHHVICAPVQRRRWKPWIKLSGTKEVNKRAFKIKSHSCRVTLSDLQNVFNVQTSLSLSLFSKCLMVLTEGFSPDPIYLIHNDDTAICRFLRGNSHVGTAVTSQTTGGLVADHCHLDVSLRTFDWSTSAYVFIRMGSLTPDKACFKVIPRRVNRETVKQTRKLNVWS
jgi:hypothetical protein